MARTFTNEPLGNNWRHFVPTEVGRYTMGRSWIDTSAPCDMMDYDFTDSFDGLYAAHAESHANWCATQVRP